MNFIRGMVTRLSIIGELFVFLWQRKLWWLIPMVAVLLLLITGVLIFLELRLRENSAIVEAVE